MSEKKSVPESKGLSLLLELVPDSATAEQIYFYIWSQEKVIADLLKAPEGYNLNIIKLVRDWIVQDIDNPIDYDELIKLRPLAFTKDHFRNLFRYGTNREVILSVEARGIIQNVLDIDIPENFNQFMSAVYRYPLYLQYALAITYFLYVKNSFFSDYTFLNFVYDGPDPPKVTDSVKGRWAKWETTRPWILGSLKDKFVIKPPEIHPLPHFTINSNTRKPATIKIKGHKTAGRGIRMSNKKNI